VSSTDFFDSHNKNGKNSSGVAKYFDDVIAQLLCSVRRKTTK
jgi:hypothetical protein